MKKVRQARISEIQAVAIYEAEVFFIRSVSRREVLREILQEERCHEGALSAFVSVSSFEIVLNRIAGWCIGGVLAALPFQLLCKVQSWAETEAANIYESAAESMATSINVEEVKLRRELLHARDQELRHAQIFRDWKK
jgi:rubrerythrin